MNRGLFAWWAYSEAALARVTAPRTDIAQADADMERIVAGSVLAKAAHASVTSVERAFEDSRVRRLVYVGSGVWRECSPVARVRATATTVVVAVLTTMVLQVFESPDVGPWRWVLPCVIGLSAAIVTAAAEPIARAWLDKRA
jgi:hypothetical protein